jgi:hypothetical protein
VTNAATAVQAKKVSLLDSGDGSTIAGYVDAYPATVSALLARIEKTFGVDIGGVLKGDTPIRSARRDTLPPVTSHVDGSDEVEAA